MSREMERVSTTYALKLDPSTTALLLTGPLGTIEDVPAIKFIKVDERQSRLLYVVPWNLDNEYVHKALQKNLRIWINAMKRLAPTSGVAP